MSKVILYTEMPSHVELFYDITGSDSVAPECQNSLKLLPDTISSSACGCSNRRQVPTEPCVSNRYFDPDTLGEVELNNRAKRS